VWRLYGAFYLTRNHRLFSRRTRGFGILDFRLGRDPGFFDPGRRVLPGIGPIVGRLYIDGVGRIRRFVMRLDVPTAPIGRTEVYLDEFDRWWVRDCLR